MADVRSLWTAFFGGRIVATDWVAEMVRPRSEVPENRKRYGLGFWLHESNDTVSLEGMDTGVSFSSQHYPVTELTHTVLSNTAEGAWPLERFLVERLAAREEAG